MQQANNKVCDTIGVKMIIIIFCLILSGNQNSFAQVVTTLNFLGDIEISKAGNKSHFYYNEIDQDHRNLRIGISQLNFMGQLTLNRNWSFKTRILLEREKGQNLKKLSTPQLNFQWTSKKQNLGFTIGFFTNPFGSFNEKQISTNRNFIGLPLAYSYYTNISPKIGFLPEMGDSIKVNIDSEIQWGSSNLYYNGYSAGCLFSWNIKPSKVAFKLALVNGASNRPPQFSNPISLGIISKLKFQPKYFWEQGISLSYGSFMQTSEINHQLTSLNQYTQMLIGTDFKLGFGFFEFSGEVIGARYKTPQFNNESMSFVTNNQNDPLILNSISGYLDFKYELPFLSGSYAAYRFDHLRFGNISGHGYSNNWDNNVLRHSLGLGYHINQYLLIRSILSTQQVKNKPWNKAQGVFRFVLTAHY